MFFVAQNQGYLRRLRKEILKKMVLDTSLVTNAHCTKTVVVANRANSQTQHSPLENHLEEWHGGTY